MTEETQAPVVTLANRTVTSLVAQRIADSSPVVQGRVVDVLVEKELQKRSDAVVKGLEKLKEAEKDLYKIKPDVCSYNADGSTLSEGWSKPKLEEKKKAEEYVAKITSAIEKALADKPDFTKLYELIK